MARIDLGRVLLSEVAQRFDPGVAEEGVVVEAHLGVERQPLARAGEDQRVDLGQGGVFGDVGVVELAGDAGEAVHLVGR